MRKVRQRALRKAFLRERGRAPNKTTWRPVWRPGLLSWIPSEWRRLKKAFLRRSR